jgi:putative membrane protein
MKHKPLIIIFSLVVPLLVALLYVTPKISAFEIDFLPLLNAIINGTVFFTLIFAVRAIKNGNRKLHQKLIYTSFILSTIFLISYVLHHATHDSVKFGDIDGNGLLSESENLKVSTFKYFYYFILISHILLSAIIMPLVLVTWSRALQEKFEAHKKIARITFPIWLYVSATGVLVYILISPYY